MDEASIMVGHVDGTALIQVANRGTFKNAHYVKHFADKMIDLGTKRFVIDLRQCAHMDSTFMGVLAQVAIRLKKIGANPPKMINVTDRNLELLKNLGLERALEIIREPISLKPPTLETLSHEFTSKDHTSKTMLDAHEALLEIDLANLPKFRDVISFLKNDLGLHNI